MSLSTKPIEAESASSEARYGQATEAGARAKSRIASIDIMRGLLALILYFPSRAFARYKHREKRNKPWLSYL